MSTWIVLLRAVNVGKRQYAMARLRATLTEAGFGDVETHIQTGNVRLTTSMRSRAKVEAAVAKALADDIGFDIEAVALTPAELNELAEVSAELSGLHKPGFGHYVSVQREPPSAAVAAKLTDLTREKEVVVVRGRGIHLLYDVPYHEAASSNATVERLSGVATNRNAKVIAALAAKWGSP